MKNFTFLLTGLFLFGNASNASEKLITKTLLDNPITYTKFNYREAEPIQFIERGIEFFVFPNGEFDFNTRPEDGAQGDYYFKTAGKRSSLTTDKHCPENYGVRIERDVLGRVRRVGNTFINYDAYDRVNRIGTVFMRYNNFALTQIGGMRIVYDCKGRIIDIFGSVKGSRSGYIRPYDFPRNSNTNDDYCYRSTPEDTSLGNVESNTMYYRQNKEKLESQPSQTK
ncbi:hypothetical protein [Flavobacterium sp.]|uniref:hypothetical protein n=1 Tax=Flavobacterium sp. TaxID=239 RepID=UPI003D139D0C